MKPKCRTVIAVVLLTAVVVARADAASAIPFGDLEIKSKNIAFVCDGSRWMKNKMVDLADELKRSIDSLSADQRFSLVFFADDIIIGYSGGKSLPATDQNKRDAKHWLERMELGSESTPIVGLTRAFESKPDTVVFISDGHFGNFDEIDSHVAKLNRGRGVRVYTIGFFRTVKEDDSRAFVEFMKQLADRHSGEFQAVYADELKRRR